MGLPATFDPTPVDVIHFVASYDWQSGAYNLRCSIRRHAAVVFDIETYEALTLDEASDVVQAILAGLPGAEPWL